LVDTFRKNSEFQNETKNIEANLYTKSWVIHSVMMSSRVVYPLLGISYWQKTYRTRAERENIDQEFIDKTEEYVKALIIVLIPLGVILDLICWRRRNLSWMLFYYELVSTVVQGFVPFDQGDYQGLVLMLLLLSNFIAVASHVAPHMIWSLLTLLFIEFGPLMLVNKQELGVFMVITKLLNGAFGFVILNVLGMQLTYIVRIKSQLVELMAENMNLFDEMHEGLVVVTDKDHSLQFASKPAMDLLMQ